MIRCQNSTVTANVRSVHRLDRLSRMTEKNPETGLIVRLRNTTRSRHYNPHVTSWVGVKWLRNRWDQLILRNGLLYRWFISNSGNEEHLQCY